MKMYYKIYKNLIDNEIFDIPFIGRQIKNNSDSIILLKEKDKKLNELINEEISIFNSSDVEKWINNMIYPIYENIEKTYNNSEKNSDKTIQETFLSLFIFTVEKLIKQVNYFNYYLKILKPFCYGSESPLFNNKKFHKTHKYEWDFIFENLKNKKDLVECIFNERDLIELEMLKEKIELQKKTIKFLNELDNDYKLEIGLTAELADDSDDRILEVFIQKLSPDKRKHLFTLSEQTNINLMVYALEHSICFEYLEPIGDIINEVLTYRFIKILPIMIKIAKIAYDEVKKTEFNTLQLKYINRDNFYNAVELGAQLITDNVRMRDDMKTFEEFYKTYKWARTIFLENNVDARVLRLKIRRLTLQGIGILGLDNLDLNSVNAKKITLSLSLCSSLMMNDFDFTFSMLPFYYAAVVFKYYCNFNISLIPFTGKPKNLVLAFVKDMMSPMQNPLFNNSPESIALMKKEINNDLNKDMDIEKQINELNAEYKKKNEYLIKLFDDYINNSKIWKLFDFLQEYMDSKLYINCENI